MGYEPRMLLGALLAAFAAQAGASPVSVSLASFTPVGDFAKDKADLYLDFFAQRLDRSGQWKVTTAAQVAQVLGLERQRQLLGCTDSSTCAAEIGAALGSDTLVFGTIGKVGSALAVNLRLVETRTGASLASVSERLSTEDALFDWLERAATEFTVVAIERLRPGQRYTATQPNRIPGVLVLSAGLAAALTGGCLWFASTTDAERLRTHRPSFRDDTELNAVATRGATLQSLGVGLVLAGSAVAAAGAVLFAVLRAPLPRVTERLQLGVSPFGLVAQWGY